MAQRFAGKAYLTVDGKLMALHGNFTVSPIGFERTMIAGQDFIHGYQELPRVPFIEGDLSAVPQISMAEIADMSDGEVVAELANNKTYTLFGAICKGGLEQNTRDGTFRVRWEGLDCIEQEGSSVTYGGSTKPADFNA